MYGKNMYISEQNETIARLFECNLLKQLVLGLQNLIHSNPAIKKEVNKI